MKAKELRERERGREQVSVALSRELRASVELAAQLEHRTVSGQIRHIVAKAFEPQREGAPAL
jgi:hypothetical protein